MYGLQYLEKTVEESLSKLSLNDLGIMGQAEYMAEDAKEKVGVTRVLISAVLAAVMLEFLVGFNKCVVMYERVRGRRQEAKGHAVERMPSCTSVLFFFFYR